MLFLKKCYRLGDLTGVQILKGFEFFFFGYFFFQLH